MRRKLAFGIFSVCAVVATVAPVARAQTALAGQSASQGVQSVSATIVPPMIRFNGTLLDAQGRTVAGPVGVVFALYARETGGSALWMETQNVTPDGSGNYTVLLGSQSSNGVPTDLFASGDARWLGIQVGAAPEQPRIVLVSVPYAMKAGDAATIGGLPPSAFVLAGQPQSAVTGSGSSGQATTPTNATNASVVKSNVTNPAVTGKGVLDYIPMWDSASDIVDSAIFQKGADIGIGTITPAAVLDVNGAGDVRDTLTLFPKSTDNTLAVSGTAFSVSSTGLVSFIAGQKFPGTGDGTITGITTAVGSGLSGGGTSGTLSLEVPAAGITNAMLQDSKITLDANTAGGLTVPGAMTLGSIYTIGLKPCTASQILQYSGTVWNCATPTTGTITGITTAVGSGLSGGGTSGALSLKVPALGITNAMLANSKLTLNANTAGGLTVPGAMTLGSTYTIGLKPCVANQVLQYSGAAWNCATPAIGTITDVVAGTDLTGGGTSGSITVNLDTTKVPQLAAANAFTSSQSISGSNTTQLLNVTQSGTGGAITGSAPSGPGVAGGGFLGVLGKSSFSAGTAGLFQNTGGGKILSGLNSVGTQVFSVANTGAVTAVSFSGNGAALTALEGANVTGAVATATNATELNGLPSSAYQRAGDYATIGSNAFIGNQSVTGSVSATAMSATTSTVGSSAVYGNSTATSGVGSNGASFFSSSPQGTAVVGVNTSGGFAGYFQGPVAVTGSVAIGGDTAMSHSPRMVFSGYLYGFNCSGGCSPSNPLGFIIPDEPITITRMTIVVGNSVSNCTDNASVSVGTTTNSVTYQIVNAGTVDSGPLNLAIPAGATVTINGQPASGGVFCQSPGQISANVEYKMQ